jgi:multisubunit Na+/H+ antiporter MnhB subunit
MTTFFTSYIAFGSCIIFWLMLFIFLVLVFLSENIKNGYLAMVSFILITIIYYFKSNFNPFEYITPVRVSLYLLIGLVFSLIRCYFYSKRIKNTIMKGSGKLDQRTL